jgi:hypothetical protein
MIRIIIAGGRDFKDYEYLCDMVSDYILMNLPPESWSDIEIVSGCANGADKLGERYGRSRDLTIKRFPAKWKRPDGTTDRGAGIKRNHEMGDYADILLAFWNGVSNGTKDMIDYAFKKGLDVEVFYYESDEDE